MQPSSAERRSVMHYDLLEKVGQGGMGVVYRAHDCKLDRIVALKFLHDGSLDTAKARERFIHEALAVSRLNHRHIAVIHAIEEHDSQLFLVFEYLPGGTLRTRIEELNSRNEKMNPEKVAAYGEQIASALSHAHSAGIVHRDVKPGNIMFAGDCDLKVVDFGVSKHQGLRRLTEDGAMVGTRLYASPEQILGRDVDARSDVFSLGMVLFEMATGKPPFIAERPEAIIHKILHEPVRSIRASSPAFPPEFEQIIKRTLEKDPGSRYARMLDLANDLRHLQNSRPVSMSEGPTKTLAFVAVGKRRKPLALVATAIVVLTLVILMFKPLRDRFGFNSAQSQYLRQGIEYLNKFYLDGNVEKAIAAFSKAIQLNPKSADAHAWLGESYLQQYRDTRDRKFLDDARTNANQALALDSASVTGEVASGMVLADSGDREGAIAAFRRALGHDPKDVEALRELATVYAAGGNAPAAESLYRQAEQLRPSDWNTWSQAGVFHYRDQNYREAEKDFREVTTLAPDSPAAHRNLGAIDMANGKFADAEKEFKASANLAPTASAYSNLGALYIYQKRYSDAVGVMQKAIALTTKGHQKTHMLWGNLGEAYLYTPRQESNAKDAYRRAIEEVEKQLAFAPDDPDLLSYAAVYWVKVGERRQALDEIGRALNFAHGDRDVSFRAALVYELTGARDRALSALGDAIRGGYSLDEIEGEPALANLRTDIRYREMVAAKVSQRTSQTKEKK